jgi:prepilin-type N-terminal cleavage/methylation domain-containing protein
LLRSQRGITLVELLATLAILSFIGVIIWSVFFQGANYSQKAVTKNALQQEANIVITNLKTIHRTSDSYQISDSGCKLTATITKNNKIQSQEFSNSKFCISARFTYINTGSDLTSTDSIDPNNQDISFEITIKDNNDSNNQIVENGILYRLKDGGV